MYCRLIQLASGRWHCPACDPEAKRTLPLAANRNCPAELELRTEAQQAALAAICRANACGRFDSLNDACRSCGCTSERHQAWLSRLRIGRCPAGQWPG